jgi:hypothetical protein
MLFPAAILNDVAGREGAEGLRGKKNIPHRSFCVLTDQEDHDARHENKQPVTKAL